MNECRNCEFLLREEEKQRGDGLCDWCFEGEPKEIDSMKGEEHK